MIVKKSSIKSNVDSSNESSVIWRKNCAELFPCASGIQAPYVGQADSVCVTTKGKNPTPVTVCESSSFLNDEVVCQKTKRKTSLKPRMLGDVAGPFMDTSTFNLHNLLPQTSLYIPDVGQKRCIKQKQKKLKEISNGLNFSNDAIASHCSHFIDYNDEELKKTVFKKARYGRRQREKGAGNEGSPQGFAPKHTLCHFRSPFQRKVEKRYQRNSYDDIDKQMKEEMEDILCSVGKSHRPTRSNFKTSDQPAKSSTPTAEWDEYVLALLSRSTAKLLTDELSTGVQQIRLKKFLKTRYEKKKQNVKATSEDSESCDNATRRRNSRLAIELDKVLAESKLEPHYTPSFTLPSAVGDKKLTSENIFQQEMLAGAFPLNPPGKRAPPKSIVLDTNSHLRFEKRLQANFPQDPNKWSQYRRTSGAVKVPSNCRVVKGLQRWNQLPALLQDDAYIPSFQTFEEPSKTLREIELTKAHKTGQNNSIHRISEEWRSKWLLEKRWQNASTEDLVRAMNDINDHVRLAAVAACSKALELRERKRADQGFRVKESNDVTDTKKRKKELEPELLECILKLLEDNCKQVQITAAVILCSLEFTEPKAIEVLKDSAQHGNDTERWMCAQCLAMSGYCTDYVISELLAQTSNMDLVRQEQSAVLLWKLSHQSTLVHSVVAELLNSSSCHDRLIACRLLPRLKGPLNKDIAQKFSHIMWNDWDRNVRTAAAQALGRTGNGKLVHDSLLKRLLHGNERMQADAIRKLSNLGIMTTQLLPAFLACFNSEFVAVRIEAAKASGAINTPHEDIVSALVTLVNEDPCWKVIAHAINAIGTIGVTNDDIVEVISWSMRYNKEAAVRAEACNAAARLRLKDHRALSALQDRLIVETEDIVRREAEQALNSLQVKFTGDLEMLGTIQCEVKHLCKKENVVTAILKRDRQDDYGRDFKRFITNDTAAQKPSEEGSRTQRTATSSEGWNPILAGFRARSSLSEPSTGTIANMERSRLPMDLNSATSEGSRRTKSDVESEYTDSIRSKSRSASVDETVSSEKCFPITPLGVIDVSGNDHNLP